MPCSYFGKCTSWSYSTERQRQDWRSWCLVVPKAGGLRNFLLEELHSSHYSGHMGIRKTIQALQARVWWPKLPEDVKKFVRGCSVC